MLSRDVNVRFDEKVDRSSSDGCWSWTGAKYRRGYGRFKVRSHVQVASHRFAFERAYGAIAEGLCVCHRCDNPACVRPDHLFLGTAEENRLDMIAKGRQRGNPAPKKNYGPHKNPRARRVHGTA